MALPIYFMKEYDKGHETIAIFRVPLPGRFLRRPEPRSQVIYQMPALFPVPPRTASVFVSPVDHPDDPHQGSLRSERAVQRAAELVADRPGIVNRLDLAPEREISRPPVVEKLLHRADKGIRRGGIIKNKTGQILSPVIDGHGCDRSRMIFHIFPI